MDARNPVEMSLEAIAPNHWRTVAGEEWCNPGGGLWGGYAIGLAIRTLQVEPEARGEALSVTLTYASALPAGQVEIRTRRLRQGGSVGFWQVEMCPGGSDEPAVHAVASLARRPQTRPFAFASMPHAPHPESLVDPDAAGAVMRYGAQAFERRLIGGFPPEPGGDSLSLAWVRPRHGPLSRMQLGMITDSSPPRAMYALGRTVRTTTLSLTVYLHATDEEIAAVGDEFILVECEGRVGGRGASDERSSYWSRDGRLLATSEQLAWYRDLPPAED